MALLTHAIVIGPVAGLKLVSVEGHKQTDNLSADSLIEVQMAAQQFRAMRLRDANAGADTAQGPRFC